MRKLKELTLDELHQLYDTNREFRAVIWDNCYEDNMYWQGEETKEIFGRNNSTYEYHDNYSSFYLRVKDYERFVDSIKDTDYLSPESIELYGKAKELSDKWNAMDYDEQDENEELYHELEQAADALMASIEKQLRDYEDVDDEQIDDMLQQIKDGGHYMSDWETDGEKVYEHITKEYK